MMERRMRPVVEVGRLPLHRFVEFTEGSPGTAEAMRRLPVLAGREIDVAPSLDRTLAAASGITARLEQYLVRTWTSVDGERSFTCRGWDRLIAANETCYKEIILEFLGTCDWGVRSDDLSQRIVRFRLGGIWRECTVVELARRGGIYTEEETAIQTSCHS